MALAPVSSVPSALYTLPSMCVPLKNPHSFCENGRPPLIQLNVRRNASAGVLVGGGGGRGVNVAVGGRGRGVLVGPAGTRVLVGAPACGMAVSVGGALVSVAVAGAP